jgi:glycosyltransferase involved in cell wall biosynthesis
MRIALLTNFVPPYRVPVFRALRERAGELRVFISTPMERNRNWQADWADLDVVLMKTWTLSRQWRHEKFREDYELHVPYDAIAQLRKWRPDAVITAEFGARSLQAITYASGARVPVVIWATLVDHLEAGRGRVRALARRFILRHVDGVIVNGEGGARYIRSLGFDDARVARVHQPIDVAAFTAIPLARAAENARRIVYVGSLSERKGVSVMVEGAALWGKRHPEARLRLLIVGDGPERERVRGVTVPSNVDIEYAGAVAYEELPGWYARAGIAIFPTRGDEWGLVVNEATAAGIPVLGSEYAQAVDELIEDGVNGWRFRPDDADQVAVAIERALATPTTTLNEMRARARQTGSAITPQVSAEKILALLHTVSKPGS